MHHGNVSDAGGMGLDHTFLPFHASEAVHIQGDNGGIWYNDWGGLFDMNPLSFNVQCESGNPVSSFGEESTEIGTKISLPSAEYGPSSHVESTPGFTEEPQYGFELSNPSSLMTEADSKLDGNTFFTDSNIDALFTDFST